MRDRSETWLKLAANGEFKMESVAVINGVEYTSITAPILTSRLLSDESVSVGNCIASTLQFSLMTNDSIPKSAEVVIKCRITDETVYSEWMEFGHYWIDHRTINTDLEQNLLELECFDAMLKGNQEYSDNSQAMEWPKPMTTVVARIAEQMGVQIDPRTVIKTGGDYKVLKPDDGTTLLDILKWIGELHGGNWIITPENKLRLVPLISAPSETFYIVDEYKRRITTPEGDRLVWRTGEQFVMPDGIGYINVPVVLGEIKKYNDDMANLTASTVLGDFTLTSGTFHAQADETYFRGIVGNGETAEQTDGNYYSSGSSTITVFRYDMPIILPDDVEISRVHVNVNGHAEMMTEANEYMCVRLVSGNTYLSDEFNFKVVGRPNTTITLECNTVPTVEQLASMQLECRIGWYGGAINGATVYVEYNKSAIQKITGVTIKVDSEHTYSAGTNDDCVLSFENPYGTQGLCDALYSEVNGIEYSPYMVTGAVCDPAMELGDMVFVSDIVHSIAFNTVQRFDTAYSIDISAPGEDELESEYPYRSIEKKTEFKIQELNESLSSRITQTQSSITAEVNRATEEEGKLSGRISVNAGDITAEVNRATGEEGSLSSRISQNATNIELRVRKDSVIASINASIEESGGSLIQISADKVNLSGYATFTALQTQGQTIINGGNITTGYMSLNRLQGGTITLGGTGSNTNGLLQIKNTDDFVIVQGDNTGMHIYNGDISGSTITLGGQGNNSGSIVIKDSYDNLIASMNREKTTFVIGKYSPSASGSVDGTATLDGEGLNMAFSNPNQNTAIGTSSIRIIYQDRPQVWTSGWMLTEGKVGNNPTDYYETYILPCESTLKYHVLDKSYGWIIDPYLLQGEYNGSPYQHFKIDLFHGIFSFSGTKSRVVSTDQYSQRLLYCYETPSPLFGDVGEGIIADDGFSYVPLDAVFAQTVTTNQYQVLLQKYGDGDCWIKERNGAYFVVQGTPGLAFGWEIKAKQRDYDQLRLERYDKQFDVPKQTYAKDAEYYLDKLRKGRIA